MTATIETSEARGVGSTFGERTPLSSYAEWMVATRAVQMQRGQLLLLYEEPQVDFAEGVAGSHARASIETNPDAYADAATILLRHMPYYATTRRKYTSILAGLSVGEITQLRRSDTRYILQVEEIGRQMLMNQEFINSRAQNACPLDVSRDALQIIDTALALQTVFGVEDLAVEAVDVRTSGFLHLAALTLE